MAWYTSLLVAAYIGVCEYRAPTPWSACESRWNWALGVLVPSPVPAAMRFLQRRKPRDEQASS